MGFETYIDGSSIHINMKRKKHKALVLLSGGLDSRLAVKILEEQFGKENLEAVFFVLPFGGGCCNDKFCVFRFAQAQALKLHIVDLTKGALFRKYMEMVKKPKFPRGTAMNPCIDCHIFMLREAKKLAKKTGADIIATGEVLGERPLSQNKRALALVERESGLAGRLLRPLSAKLLPETEAERKGWLEREKLLDIEGRRRKKQMALARKYKITFPNPAGGCILTEKDFSRRLLNFLENKKGLNMNFIELLRTGRHFLSGKSTIIVGRNEEENNRLLKIAKREKLACLEARDYTGPLTVITAKRPSESAIQKAAALTVRYSDAPEGRAAEVVLKTGKKSRLLKVRRISEEKIERLRV
jgi:tRNA U34 2-thiouridine synthase MnmA/TrmU